MILVKPESAKVAAAAALEHVAAKNPQTCSATFAADIDAAEKGTINVTTVQLDTKRLSATKSSGPAATPITKLEKSGEKREGSITGTKPYAETYAAVEGVIRQLAGEDNIGEELILGGSTQGAGGDTNRLRSSANPHHPTHEFLN
jgi:hypothetical protein